MIRRLFTSVRRGVFIAVAGALLGGSLAAPGSAQMGGGGMKTRIVDAVANTMVSDIQSSSCAQFAGMMRKRKSGSSSGRAGGMLKSDPALRQRFVNRVAGPLVNKMIDCDLLPGH